MFKGTIKDGSRKILLDFIKSNSHFTKVANWCAGNFTIPILIAKNSDIVKEISCNDASIYTNAIGHFLSDQDFDFKLLGAFEFLNAEIETLLDKTASVLLLQDYANYLGKNDYNKRMRNYIIADYKKLLDMKKARLVESKEFIVSKGIKINYWGWDVVDFVKTLDKDSVFISFPPFFKGDYEKQYKFIEETIDSTVLKPSYRMFDGDSLKAMVKTLQDNGNKFLIATNKYELFCEDPAIECIGYNYFSKTEMVYFITNIWDEVKLVRMTDKVLKNYDVELIKEEDIDKITIKSKLEIKEIPLDLLDNIRRTRISSKVKKLSAPIFKCWVWIDGKLAGIFGVDVWGVKGDPFTAYMLSDLPVVNHRDIAKLIWGLATTKEVQKVLRERYFFAITSILTTAFTDRPQSMKYRNFWKVQKRGETDGKKYINYEAVMGSMTSRQVFQKWINLISNREKNDSDHQD